MNAPTTAYDRKAGRYDAGLTEVGRGTPMDAVMRRYWHPGPEAHSSQGPITLHGEQRPVSSDRGIVMPRRLYRKQMEIVAAGRDRAVSSPSRLPATFARPSLDRLSNSRKW